ncbi:MAG: tripartite tricarboxylate transporter TctB family protein [Euzebyales bacterium]|nr:tripartite tricarboxylate transporter TctB family protein [Euzebyales bacterium]
MAEQQAPQERPRFPRSRQEIAVAAVFLVVFVFFRVRLDSFIAGRRGATFIEPDFWPTVLLTFGIAVSALYLVRAVVNAVRDGSQATPPDDGAATDLLPRDAEAASGPESSRGNLLALAGGLALLAAYIFGLRVIGFAPSTLVFCVAFLLFVGERKPAVLIGFPLVITAVVLGVFTRLLVVPLPRGVGVFLQLSTYLY